MMQRTLEWRDGSRADFAVVELLMALPLFGLLAVVPFDDVALHPGAWRRGGEQAGYRAR